jgi:mono/diheme cytochrome c family protein
MSITSRISLVIAAVLASCAEPVPDTPTWFADVQPIVGANCARCHGAIPENEMIAGFRLDRYVAGDANTLDAYDYRESIVRHAVDGVAPVMPPAAGLSDRQREILERWVLADAPKGTRANAVPTAVLVAPAVPPAEVDQELAVTVRAGDADGDGLVVSMRMHDLTTDETWLLPMSLGAGTNAVTIDTGQLASTHDFEISAIVDDGFSDDPEQNQHVVMLLPSVRVDHGARGTAPTVRLLEPNGGQALIGETTIAWTATDPDAGDTLTIDLELIRVAADGAETVAATIASDLTGVSTHVWDATGVPTEEGGHLIAYKVRVTATDAGALNTRSDASDATFTIAPMSVPTTLTWDDVKGILATYCLECHGQPARTVALEYFRVDKYDAADATAPSNTDDGVYETRNLIYQRMVAAGTMPPNARPQPTAAEVAAVGEWILGGAPRSGGPSDAPPTFTWSTPNDGSVSRTTSGMIALAWSTSDPEGLTVTGQIEYARLAASADQNAFCDAPLTGWATIPVSVDAGAFAWTVPGTGYYCLRATVSDPGGNTTVRTARRPVRYTTTPGP